MCKKRTFIIILFLYISIILCYCFFFLLQIILIVYLTLQIINIFPRIDNFYMEFINTSLENLVLVFYF